MTQDPSQHTRGEPESESNKEEEQGPVIRDKRRLDPQTGEVRQEAQQPPAAFDRAAAGVPTGKEDDLLTEEAKQLLELQQQVEERTADLQRVQAEYANYRKRVDRDRALVGELAKAQVLTELLPIFDSIDKAREHGELVGGFKAVADALREVTTRLGLECYGKPKEVFDPAIHEALAQVETETPSEEPIIVEVIQPGYRMGERILRPARVAVTTS